MEEARALLRDALAERWKIYSSRLKECQEKCGGESLRRLRVAIRRLLSHLEAAQQIHRTRNGQKARQLLKSQLKALGPLRDIQMQICHLEAMKSRFPRAGDVLRWLGKRENKKLQRARRVLKKIDCGKLEEELHKAIRKSERFLANCGVSVGTRTQKALATSFQKARTRFEALDPQDVETIHSLRVAFKHFRYLSEALKGRTAPGLRGMKRYQARMGEIQDMEVLMRTLHTFACRKRKDASRALGPLRRETRRRRNAAIRTFWGQRNEFFKFAPTSKAPAERKPKPSYSSSRMGRGVAAGPRLVNSL